MVRTSRKKTDRKSLWLEMGLDILSRRGPASVSVDHLCRRMGKTKGAFYHHFRSRNDYIEALMRYYRKKTTEDIIGHNLDDAPADVALRRLREQVLSIPGRTELAIRAWALYDPIVKRYQDRIDEIRLRYLERHYRRIYRAERKAAITALRHYSTYLGFQQLGKHVAGDARVDLTKDLFV